MNFLKATLVVLVLSCGGGEDEKVSKARVCGEGVDAYCDRYVECGFADDGAACREAAGSTCDGGGESAATGECTEEEWQECLEDIRTLDCEGEGVLPASCDPC